MMHLVSTQARLSSTMCCASRSARRSGPLHCKQMREGPSVLWVHPSHFQFLFPREHTIHNSSSSSSPTVSTRSLLLSGGAANSKQGASCTARSMQGASWPSRRAHPYILLTTLPSTECCRKTQENRCLSGVLFVTICGKHRIGDCACCVIPRGPLRG